MNAHSSLINAYAGGDEPLRTTLQAAAGVDVDARPISGHWSIREVVCHLADTEIVYADRMKRVIVEENPTFFEADPDLFSALHCASRPIDLELQVIAAVRAHMVPILRSLDSDVFQRRGEHSLDGAVTLEVLLNRVTNHIPHHLRFIEEKVAALKK